MKKLLKWVLIGFGALFVLGLIGSAMSDSDTSTTSPTEPASSNLTNTQANSQNSEEVTVVDSAEFVAEFDKNQLAAEEKYEGKWIQTTGYIDNISEDILGKPFVVVQPTDDEYYFGTSVQCSFKDTKQLVSLENGQMVTVKGKVSSQVANVLVDDCEVVSETE